MTDHTEPTQEERKAAHERAVDRYFAAPGDERIDQIRVAVATLGTLIDLLVPAGRNKALALTALEDTHMRANRGIWAPEGQA